MKKCFLSVFLIAAAFACSDHPTASGRLRIALSYPSTVGARSLDGRMLLLLSTDGAQEPRFQVTDNDRTQQAFGVVAALPSFVHKSSTDWTRGWTISHGCLLNSPHSGHFARAT